MDYTEIIKNLTLYESDLYSGKIIIEKRIGITDVEFKKNMTFQTDAICWYKKSNKIYFKNYNYVLIRKFIENEEFVNELYYDIDELKDKGLKIENFFPFYPNFSTLKLYFKKNNDIPIESQNECIDYVKVLNKHFYK